MNKILTSLAAAFLIASATTAAAQPARLQTPAEALAQDAGEYARAQGVGLDEAIARLRAQEGSVPETDRIAALYRDRLAGISIEHHPRYRIVVLLTGDAPVRDRFISAGGTVVPVAFRTGAAATRDELAGAIRRHMGEIRARVPGAQGMGVDPRTGELVLLVGPETRRGRVDAIRSEVEALTGVPVRVSAADRAVEDFASPEDLGLGGGSRVAGVDPRDGRRYVCTAGFVVTDEVRTGVVTAAHCPDELFYRDPLEGEIALGYVGQWGVGHQDVQVNVSDRAQRPLFYADTARTVARTLTGARALAGTRAGELVCHRGETSGYGCSLVELIDFSPPGDLCAGPCDPVWVTVAGPQCRHGDSGGPVFLGTTAFGITKGGSYGAGGRCSFYFYMSTDYLPAGWRLLGPPPGPVASTVAAR